MVAARDGGSEMALLLLHLGERDALASPIAYMETKAWMLCPTIFCVIDIKNLGWCSKRVIGTRLALA